MSQYSTHPSSFPASKQIGSSIVQPPADIQAEKHLHQSDGSVTPKAWAANSVLSREEKIEYRDQDGNILDEKQVKSLEGKVSFSTRYETKTRIVDAAGNEIADGLASADGFAPPHPNINSEPETIVDHYNEVRQDSPASVSPDHKLEIEKNDDEAKSSTPRPGSEAKKATV